MSGNLIKIAGSLLRKSLTLDLASKESAMQAWGSDPHQSAGCHDPYRRGGQADAWGSLARQCSLIKPLRTCLRKQPLQLCTKRLAHLSPGDMSKHRQSWLKSVVTKKSHECVKRPVGAGGRWQVGEERDKRGWGESKTHMSRIGKEQIWLMKWRTQWCNSQDIWHNWRLSWIKTDRTQDDKHCTFSVICGSYVCLLKVIIYQEFHNLVLPSLSSLHRLLFALWGL